jgi:hypothetical protein
MASREVLIQFVEMGLTADEIYARLPKGSYASPQVVRVRVANLRAQGLLPPSCRRGVDPQRFSMSSMGEQLWLKLVRQSVERHQTPWEFAKMLLEIVLSEPTLLKNLIDEIDDREAAE